MLLILNDNFKFNYKSSNQNLIDLETILLPLKTVKELKLVTYMYIQLQHQVK